MQLNGQRDAGTSQHNGDLQAAEARDDARVAVMEDDAPADEVKPRGSTDHPEVFTVDLLGSWFKP